MGDSHAALFGQDCRSKGDVKVTYGTGASIMMNVGNNPIKSRNGLVTSLAWSMDGKVQYVLEGNLNYAGAVISWLKNDMELIKTPQVTEEFCNRAVKNDSVYLVPGFSGLGAPYWDNHVKAAIVGMNRTTGKAEVVRAAVECIAYQVTDIVRAMEEDLGANLTELRVDGGATKNSYLMQFQSDISRCKVEVAHIEELSGMGVAVMAGLSLALWSDEVFGRLQRRGYHSEMEETVAKHKYYGWKQAVGQTMGKNEKCN